MRAAGASGLDPESFFDGHFALPPLPAVVDRLLRTIESGKATAGEVAALLAADPGITAQILKIVNSAYYGLPREIRDVKHAVAYLGFGEIQRIVLTVAVMDRLAPDDQEAFESFWYHSFYTALATKALSRRFSRGLDAEELHSAALLHDVGKLIYLKFFPEHYHELTAHAERLQVPLHEAEAALDLPPHCAYGETLAERWGLPELVRRACARHELPHLQDETGDPNDHEALTVIALANLLTNLASAPLTDDHKLAIREIVMARLSCDEDEFLLLMGEIYDLQGEVQEFLRDL